jgi:hypothetical protein
LPFKRQVEKGREQQAYEALIAFLEGRSVSVPWLSIPADDAKRIGRQWKLRSPHEQRLLRDLLPRFDMDASQIERILSDQRATNGIEASARRPDR